MHSVNVSYSSLCDLSRPTPIVTDMDNDGLAGKQDVVIHVLLLVWGGRKRKKKKRKYAYQ